MTVYTIPSVLWVYDLVFYTTSSFWDAEASAPDLLGFETDPEVVLFCKGGSTKFSTRVQHSEVIFSGSHQKLPICFPKKVFCRQKINHFSWSGAKYTFGW